MSRGLPSSTFPLELQVAAGCSLRFDVAAGRFHISGYYGTLSFCHFRARIDRTTELLSAGQQYEYELGRHQAHTHHP